MANFVTLFKITCDTCRTSLNVRQKSAIGQILACPKCSSMVQVKPPKGWEDDEPESEQKPRSKKPFVKPVPDPKLPETVSTISGSVSEGLQNDPSSKAKPADQRWQGDDNSEESSGPESEPTSRQPMLPGDQWDSSRAKQRKKLLFAFSTAIAVLVFGIAAIVFAAMQLSGGGENESEEVADANPASKTDESEAKSKGEPPQKESYKVGANQKQNSEKGPKKQADPPGNGDTDPNKKSAKNKMPEKSDPAKDRDPAKEKTDPLKSDEKNASKKDDADPPGFESKKDPDLEGLPDFFRELDEFAVIFEQDEPLLKLREAFEEDDLPGEFGLSRFYIAKSLKKTPKPDKALNVPLAEIAFQQITLLDYLDFHYQMTSVPVAVDVTPILLSGIQLDQKFDIRVKDKSVLEVLKEVAAVLDLEVVKGTHSLVLTIKNRNTQVEVDYPVSDIAPTASDRQKLIDQIQRYVDKRSWSAEGGEGIITANDAKNSIVVKHFGWAQVRIREFLRHVRAQKGLALKSPNPNFPGNQHRLVLSQAARDQEITILRSDPVSLSELLAQIAKEHNIHVFLNWEATGEKLLPSGNLPLSIEAEKFDQFITELAATAKLDIVWHSERIVELTSGVGSSSNLTFESYNIRNVTNQEFTANDLLEALRKLLATNNLADFEKAEIGLDLQDQTVIYGVLPQSAHRNVLKILSTVKLATEK